MNTLALDAALARANAPWYARQILQLLQQLQHGTLAIRLPNAMEFSLGSGSPQAQLHIESWHALRYALARGDVGFAEGYIDGLWSTPDLTGLLGLLAANRDSLGSGLYGNSWWGRLATRLKHLLNANTRAGSRRNIAAHYDLGNDFYRLWLDPGMSYSSALFNKSSDKSSDGGSDGDAALTLEAAQTRKYQAMLDFIEPDASIKPGIPMNLLEIGCGRGGFAEHAGRQGHAVRGLTLSTTEQLGYANARLAAQGLADACPMLLQDYRDESGQYDGIISVEMFEAVGEPYWATYFATLKRALKPGGRAAIQTILIDHTLFERYRAGSDFIQQYIFPGGMLPSATRFAEEAARAGLRVTAARHFGLDYAETLARWRHAFFERIDAIRALGFDTRFERIWHFYLAYCEAGFRAGSIDVAQFRLEHAA